MQNRVVALIPCKPSHCTYNVVNSAFRSKSLRCRAVRYATRLRCRLDGATLAQRPGQPARMLGSVAGRTAQVVATGGWVSITVRCDGFHYRPQVDEFVVGRTARRGWKSDPWL